MQILGRMAVPQDKVRETVGTRGKKQIKAFNLFDGTRTMADVAKKAKINQGNLSRTASRWVANGIMFWIGSGRESRLLHIYAIPEGKSRRAPRGRRRRT